MPYPANQYVINGPRIRGKLRNMNDTFDWPGKVPQKSAGRTAEKLSKITTCSEEDKHGHQWTQNKGLTESLYGV